MATENREHTLSVFFSYSHRDKKYRDELDIHLAVLKREGLITTWYDRRIEAGQDFDREIQEHLETSDIVLLLVSAYLLASDYCYKREMTRALERHEEGDAVVVPIIIRPCDWKNAPFGKLRATPADGKPISKFQNLDDAYLAVVSDIRRAAELISKQPEVHRDPVRPPLAAES